MLSSFLYNQFKTIFKGPLKIVLGIVAVLFMTLMILFPTLMSSSGETSTRDPQLIVSVVGLFSMVLFDGMLFSCIKQGTLGFSTADVTFFLAGPYTPRFNLIHILVTSFVSSILMIFVLTCQAALFTMLLSVTSLDFVVILLLLGLVIFTSYFIGMYVNVLAEQFKHIRKIVTAVIVVLHLIWAVSAVIALVNEAGSLAAISNLGLTTIANTIANKLFVLVPVAGWVHLALKGIFLKETISLVVGILILVIAFALLYISTSVVDASYYEKAILFAQKIEDIKNMKKAGIDSDAIALSANAKVDGSKGSLISGDGAKAFFAKHLLENKRMGGLFFVNSQATLYKVIAAAYSLFMAYDTNSEDWMMIFSMTLFMIVLLDSMAYAGGRLILEFNKPYFARVPEKTSKKVFWCVLGVLPESLFNAVLCLICMILPCIVYNVDYMTIPLGIGLFFLFVGVPLLTTVTAVCLVRIFKSLGKNLLLFIRYFVMFILLGVPFGIGAVVGIIFDSLAVFAFATALVLFIMFTLFCLLAGKIMDTMEY